MNEGDAMAMKFKAKVTVKKKYIVNGKEYNSPEEMSDDIRRAYEKGLAFSSRNSSNQESKIIFNGQEYESMDTMPDRVRRMYENAMDMLRENEASGQETYGEEADVSHMDHQEEEMPARVGAPKPIVPKPSFPRWLVVGLLLFALIWGLYLYRHP